MPVSDIPVAKIINERTKLSEYLWLIPTSGRYVWDDKVAYRFSSGAIVVDGQGISAPVANAANSQTSADQYFWKVKGREIYVWDSRVAYRWAIGSTPVAGYPQPPARKTKQYPQIKNGFQGGDLLWLIPVTGIIRWDDRVLYMDTMQFDEVFVRKFLWTGAVNGSVSEQQLSDGTTIRNYMPNPSAEGATLPFLSWAGTATSMVNDVITGPGSRSFRLLHNTNAALAGVRLGGSIWPTAKAGERWWGRARLRLDAATIGARKVSCKLVFRNSSGAVVGHSQAQVGSGSAASYRWLGEPYSSGSERVQSGKSATNRALTARGAVQLGVYANNPTVNTHAWNVAVPATPTGVTTAVSSTRANGQSTIQLLSTYNVDGLGNLLEQRKIGAYVMANAPGYRARFADSPWTTLASNEWTWITGSVYGYAVAAIERADGTTTPAGDYAYITSIVIPDGFGANPVPSDYFDGAFVSGVRHRWDATKNASISTRAEGGKRRVNYAEDPGGVTQAWWSRWFGGSAGVQGFYENVPNATDGPINGPNSYARKTWTTPSPSGSNGNVGFNAGANLFVPMQPGEVYTLSGWFRSSVGGLYGTRAKLQWVRPDGAYDVAFGNDAVVVEGEWVRMSVTATVPAGAIGAYPLLDVDSGDTFFPAGTHFEATGALLELSSSVGSYFDGSTPNVIAPFTDQSTVDLVPGGAFHRWIGTANASKSERYSGTTVRVNDVIDPLFTNTNAWYKNPSATYDFTQPGSVKITVTTAIAAGGLVTYPAAGTAPNEFGMPKVASYRIKNTGTAPVTIYGNTRAYGAAASIDGANSADVTIAPGETVLFRLPPVIPSDATVQGYRALIRNRSILPVGQTLVISEHIGETAASPALVAGAFFSGASANTGTGNTQEIVDLVVAADAPVGATSADLMIYRDGVYQSALNDIEYADSILLTKASTDIPPKYFDGSTANNIS